MSRLRLPNQAMKKPRDHRDNPLWIVPAVRGGCGDGSGQGRDFPEGPSLVGEFAFLQLAVDQRAIHHELEAAAIGGLKLQRGDFLLEAGEQFRRQTDGLGFIISLAAIAQMDLHPSSPWGSP